MKKSYKLFGAIDLISKRRFNPSPNNVLQKAISIINKKYYDFGPTFEYKKIREKHNIKITVESIHKLIIKESLWKDIKYKIVIVHQNEI